jgi:hypothetical protein
MIPVGRSVHGPSTALAVNNLGLVAGWSAGTGTNHATVWRVR